MTPNAILEDVQRRPFRPFRIAVSDGSFYDIHHPEFCMVGTSYIVVGVASNPASPLFERTDKVDCRHVVKIYELPSSAQAGGNGQQN